jgi:hypothetical protein
MQNSIIQWFATRFMDRPLQPRELLRARKAVYVVLIVALFTVSFFWRRNVEAQAQTLAVQEESRGEVELSGSLIRLSLTGSRGLATCVLWVNAMDKQKKNQWNELEFYVRSLTKLQPHFITPWLFQSWNLSYNVAVDCDRVFDKYFYIARGIQLLGEGERQNRDHPDLRFSMGFYLQHKVCASDETNTMRSLYQLSLIPPSKRDPARFYTIKADGTREFNWNEFEAFCKENPKLVRRLRKGLFREDEREQRRQFTCERPDEVIQFLSDNWRVPSVYFEIEKLPSGVAWQDSQGKDKLLPVPDERRFPVLPPPPFSKWRPLNPPQHLFEPYEGFSELNWGSNLDDNTDAYTVARAWFSYAQEPIPDPRTDYPGLPPDIVDRVHQRKPYMTVQIFRGYPALCQKLRAESLQQEGWFDQDPWDIPDWFQPRGNRFHDGTPARLALAPVHTSSKAWSDCYEMWDKLGRRTLVKFESPADEANMIRKAEAFLTKYGLGPDANPQQFPIVRESLSEEDGKGYDAARYMWEYRSYRSVSNFPHHYYRASIEKDADTITARKLFYQAENWRLLGSPDRALAIYRRPGALEAWLEKVLAWRDLDVHRQFREDALIQEHTYETQLNYLVLLREQYGTPVRQQLARFAFAASLFGTAVPGGFSPVPAGLPLFETQYTGRVPAVEIFREPFAVPVLNQHVLPNFAVMMAGMSCSPVLPTPLMAAASVVAGNRPLIDDSIVRQVLERRKLLPPSAPPKEPTQGQNQPGPRERP